MHRHWWSLPLLVISLAFPAGASAATGDIYNFAGNTGGSSGSWGDGGAATSAGLSYPAGVAVLGGSTYIGDYIAQRVRRVNSSGTIFTYAGTGSQGYSGNGGVATSAMLNGPADIERDSAGNLYIADSGNARIRKVTPGGIISTFAGTGSQGYSGDGGAATLAQLYQPVGLKFDAVGNLYIADMGNHTVRKVTPGGTISTVAGTGIAGY